MIAKIKARYGALALFNVVAILAYVKHFKSFH